MNMNTESLTRLDSIAEPTVDDLLTVEAEVADFDPTDWEALLEPVIEVAPKFDEDYWAEDENVHDDRYDGGIPSWSAWA